MARIRSIKPETWTDPAFVRCTPLARLLWIGTWNLADDQGVLKDEPERIRFAILPGDDVDAEALVEELVTERLLLRKRTTDGQAVLVIRTFREHQKIDTRRDGKWGDPDALVDPGTLDEALLDTGTRLPAPARAGPRPCATERDHTIKEGIKDQGSLSSSAEPTFDEFWDRYPKKHGKQEAREQWDKQVKATDANLILAGLERVLPHWALKDRQFVPDARKWLYRKRWEDELPELTDTPAPVPNGRPEPVRPEIPDADEIAARDAQAAREASGFKGVRPGARPEQTVEAL